MSTELKSREKHADDDIKEDLESGARQTLSSLSSPSPQTSLFQNQYFLFFYCVGGIYASYLFYGYRQEAAFKHSTKEPNIQLVFTIMLVMVHCAVAYLCAYLINTRIRKVAASVMAIEDQRKLGMFHSLTMLCSNTALIYVNYPTQALAKSCKILPVILIGFLYGKKYPTQRYICGVVITAGILFFNWAKLNTKTNKENSVLGLFLIVASLLNDGLLATQQEKMRETAKPHAYDLMEASNKYGTLLCMSILTVVTSLLVIQNQSLDYLYVPTAIEMYNIVTISVCGAIGQLFIFYTVEKFGPLLVSIVTTTRKFFTVLLSILIYKHDVQPAQWVAIILVFSAIVFDMVWSHQQKSKKGSMQKPVGLKKQKD